MIIKIYISVFMLVMMAIVTFAQNEIEILSVDENNGTTEMKLSGIKIEVNEKCDTTGVITIGGRRFEIVENNDNVKIFMTRVPREKFKGHFAGIDLGINTLVNSDFSTDLPLGSAFMELNAGKSVNVGINFLQYSIGLQKHRHSIGLVTGMGLNYYNYRFDSQNILAINNVTGETTYDHTNKDVMKSKFVTSFINVPLLLEFQIPDYESSFFISAGGFVGFNIGSHAKVVYNENGTKVKDKSYVDYNVKPFQYGLSTRMGYRFVKLFANYNLSALFDNDMGPELYPFTIGITLINL
ncbi:MAG: PorT family protein [Bacteroidales bacterium]|nr:PorT family protein [Bacteroidales bacterium]